MVIYTLGTDTTTIQYFEFDKGKFNTTILSLAGQLVKYEGSGILDKKGDIQEVKSKTYTIDSNGNWRLSAEGLNLFKGDSTIYTSHREGKLTGRRAIAAKGIVSNAADACSFFVFPYMGFFAPATIGDTAFHCQLSFGECRRYHVARIDHDELKIGSGVMGHIKLFVDQKGRLMVADAIGSSLNFVAIVQREQADYKSFMNQYARSRFANKQLTNRAFRDTTRLTLIDKKVEVDYWRPYRRGRQVFGAVVPWRKIWRAGANNATQLRTAANLDFKGEKLPAGKYSLWVYPEDENWFLHINKKADVWGTEYDPAADILKIPLIVYHILPKVEILAIHLRPLTDSSFRFEIEWDDYRATADFKME